jgi:hypothetical protein
MGGTGKFVEGRSLIAGGRRGGVDPRDIFPWLQYGCHDFFPDRVTQQTCTSDASSVDLTQPKQYVAENRLLYAIRKVVSLSNLEKTLDNKT